MVKLLYIENSLAVYGGMERVLIDKLDWLAQCGEYDISVITVNQGNHPLVFPLHPTVHYLDLGIMSHQKYRYKGLKRYFQEIQFNKLFRQGLQEAISNISPDIIICTRLEFITSVVSVKGNIPLIFESHGSCLAYKFECYSWLQRLKVYHWHRALKEAKMIIALTNGDAKEWRKISSNVKVIPNVVHLNSTGNNSTCLKKSAIFVGRYSYQKDIMMLLKVWEQVHLRYPDWQLHIYGDYGDLQEQALAKMRKMNINIVIHQPTPLIFDAYLNSSILLLTSRYEPFGLVLPEAMSCGIPVVAFDCPYGPSDIIDNGENGFLIKGRNINEYIEKVCLLINDVELRKAMGNVGAHTSLKYSKDVIMPQWKELFDTIVKDS